MDMKVVLRRIEARLAVLETTAAAISRSAVGSPDTIRNWQRRVAKGENPGASMATIEPIAEALGVPADWLVGNGPDDLEEFRQMQSERESMLRTFDAIRDPLVRTAALRTVQELAKLGAPLPAEGRPAKGD